MSKMKKVILTKDTLISKLPTAAGTSGVLIVQQDENGGHIVSLTPNNLGFTDVALAPNAITKLVWTRDDVYTYWESIKMTTDVVIENPSTIDSLIVEIVDTVSARIKWNAPQGFIGNNSVSADLYYLIVSTSPINPLNNYDASKLAITPLAPNQPESFIVSKLNSGQRYYVAIYSEKLAYGKTRKSAISNVGSFFTTPLDGAASTPKRIPLNANKIWESLLHINFEEGELFTNYPSFRRLAEQDYLIDNNGVPEGTPSRAIVSAYQSYGTLQPSWYNVGSYKVFFELDGLYDLDYLYMLVQNNNRFTIYTSGDGVNLFKAFDKLDTPTNMAGWTKIPLNENAKTNVRFIVLALYVGDCWFNGFVPYGTRKAALEIKGDKFKRNVPSRKFTDSLGTNAFLAENNFNYIGDTSAITRLYNNAVWIMHDDFKPTGSNQTATPDDIKMVSALSHMWNYDVKMRGILDAGQKELIFTLVAYPLYLRTGTDGANSQNTKPVNPGLNYKDLAVTTNPHSYSHMARIAASMAYRWGFNPDAPEVCNQFLETDGKKGQGLVRYYEFANEADRYWHGENAFYNPQEHAAYCSALYDGHKGALGAGMGIKAADPNSKLVLAGLLDANSSYVREMFLWWDLNRGIGDYPIDVLNFHYYSAYRDATDTPTWSTVPAYGIPPEQGTLISGTKELIKLRSLLAPSKEVINSEFGYDEQFGGMHSPLDATPALRGKHKGIWILRTCLIYISTGLDFATQFWYAGDTIRVKDMNPSFVQREKFYTSGLVDGITSAADRNREPLIAYWYVTAFRNALEGYSFSHSVMEAGILKVIEDDIILNYHPNLWVMAFVNTTTNAKCLVAWLGTGNWETFNVDLRVTNDVTNIQTIDFVNQDERVSVTGVTLNNIPLVSGGGKHAIFPITETPLVIKTELIGTAKLIEPKEIKIQSTTANAIKLAWLDENYGTNKTRIYQSVFPDRDFVIVQEDFRDTAETTVSGLVPSTTYYFKVQFVDGVRISDISNTVTTSTLFSLQAPTDALQIDGTSSTITVKWTYPIGNENEIQSFAIYRSNTENGEYLEVGRVDKGLRIFRDIGLTPSSTYYYMIRSYRDGIVSSYSFVTAGSTSDPSLLPPTIQSAEVDSSGSSVDFFFDDELKDEQTALNAFSLMERLSSGDIVPHQVTKISLDSRDKTRVKVEFDIQVFKTSTITVSYDASLGALKSIYNVNVESFYEFPITNNVLIDFSPILDWTDASNLTFNRNTLIGISGGRAYSTVKILSGATSIVQFNTDIQDTIVLGLDVEMGSEGANTFDYYVTKNNGQIEIKKGADVIYTHIDFGKGLLRLRTDGTSIYYEASSDNGYTFTLIDSIEQPQQDMYIKVYARIASRIINVVGAGITNSTANDYVDDYVDADYIM